MRHYKSGDKSLERFPWDPRMSENKTPVHVSKNLKFPISPYLQDTDNMRRNFGKCIIILPKWINNLGLF
ncbi:hypothetical protein [Algibacter mikhailovii]|nr:hypothetical protein [Algibacter mikhailovii]